MKKIIILCACVFGLMACDMTAENKQELDKLNEAVKVAYKERNEAFSENIDLAMFYESLGEYSKALMTLKKNVKEDPTHFVSLNQLVYIYEDKLGKYKEAQKYIEMMLEANPGNREVVRDAVRIHLKAESPDLAMRAILKYQFTLPIEKREAGPEKSFLDSQKALVKRLK